MAKQIKDIVIHFGKCKKIGEKKVPTIRYIESIDTSFGRKIEEEIKAEN